MMEESRGGLVIPPDRAQSLAQFTDRNILKRYLDWRIKRSSGIVSGAVTKVLIFVSMLCHAGHGFLVTRPEIGLRAGVAGTAWLERCREMKLYADVTRKRVA